MQVLYSAVMILGKSIEDIDRFGWICNTTGHGGGPKCVNGTVTWSAGAISPTYVDRFVEDVPEMRDPLHLVAVTLVENTPPKIRENLLSRWKESSEVHRSLMNPGGVANMSVLANTLITINDAYVVNNEYASDGEERTLRLLDRDSARAWFERSFWKLAAQLPTPLAWVRAERVEERQLVSV